MGDDVEEEPVGEDTQDEARGLKKPFFPTSPQEDHEDGGKFGLAVEGPTHNSRFSTSRGAVKKK